MVPHLTTALSGPLLSLEKNMLAAMPKIEHWFRTQWLEYASPFYASVDLRNSGFKLAPVDTNLFPGGFNNLNTDFLPLSVHAAMVAVEKICPEAHRLMIIPENHTRNTYYLRNVVELVNIMKAAGLDVRVGTINPEITEPITAQYVLASKGSHDDNNAQPYTTVPRNNDVSSVQRIVQARSYGSVTSAVRQYIDSTSTGLNAPSPPHPPTLRPLAGLSEPSSGSRRTGEHPVQMMTCITPT